MEIDYAVFLSDIHFEKKNDIGDIYLQKFFLSKTFLNAKYVVFVGDIFDYAAGNKKEYYERFKTFFDGLSCALGLKKKVYFVEGNHDVHLEKLIRHYIQVNHLDQNYYFHVKEYCALHLFDKKFYLSHGDDLQTSEKYQKYKKLILSSWAEKFADLLPLFLFDSLAYRASRKSRNKKMSEETLKRVRSSFIEGAKKLQKNYDGVIAGHSHIRELHQEDGFYYINCGYGPGEEGYVIFTQEGNIVTSYT